MRQRAGLKARRWIEWWASQPSLPVALRRLEEARQPTPEPIGVVVNPADAESVLARARGIDGPVLRSTSEV